MKQENNMSEKLGLRFGAMCPPIDQQLTEQGFLFKKGEIKHFQKDADALNRVRIRGLITSFEVEKATKKLVKRIANHIESLNQK